MAEARRHLGRERAGHRCEDCGILQAHMPFATFARQGPGAPVEG
jgi:hypothetical protein